MTVFSGQPQMQNAIRSILVVYSILRPSDLGCRVSATKNGLYIARAGVLVRNSGGEMAGPACGYHDSSPRNFGSINVMLYIHGAGRNHPYRWYNCPHDVCMLDGNRGLTVSLLSLRTSQV